MSTIDSHNGKSHHTRKTGRLSRLYQLAALIALALSAYVPVSAAGTVMTLSQSQSMRVPTIVMSTATASATRPIATITNTPAGTTNTPASTRTPTPAASSTPTLAVSATPTTGPTSISTATATATTEATATATTQATAALQQATSVYIDPNTTNPWARYYATRTAQAASYASLAPVSGTPTMAASSPYPSAATPGALFSVMGASGVAPLPAPLAAPTVGLAAAPSPWRPSNSVPFSQPTQIAMAPDIRPALPTADIQPDQLLGVKSDPVDQTVPVDHAYYARRLGNVGILGSALLLLAGGALGTVALVRFVIGSLSR